MTTNVSLVRVADTVYERTTGAVVAVHTRGSWYEPRGVPFSSKSERTVTEWSPVEALTAAGARRLASYEALPIVPEIHPLTAALGARRAATKEPHAKSRR
jgi:hypothetical protein